MKIPGVNIRKSYTEVKKVISEDANINNQKNRLTYAIYALFSSIKVLI